MMPAASLRDHPGVISCPSSATRLGWLTWAKVSLVLASVSSTGAWRLLAAGVLALALVAAPPAIRRDEPEAAGHRVPQDRERAAPAMSDRKAPAVEPLVFADLDPQTARQLNAAIPFATFGDDRPLPLSIALDDPGFARAVDCLASAMLYEAGDAAIGQAAVAQVVLNRVRHPAFPHSICAVVYQGAERQTGCQFTFTCDGALGRTPSPGAWQRARAGAARFLTGATYPAVGMATHYHTNWVHPYWSATLDKIARVDTHLFFRWRGTWGRRAAFSSAYAGVEPFEHKLAFLSAAHGDPATPDMATTAGSAPPIRAEDMLREHDGDHFILVDDDSDGSDLAMQGLDRCAGQVFCKVLGWVRRSQGHGSPERPIPRTVAFLYVRDKRTGVEIVLWDCTRFNRPSDRQCLSDKNRRWITFEGDLSHAS